MTIKQTTKTVAPIIQTRNLIPKDQYKGTILKLTEGDKKKIQELLKQQACLEGEINKLLTIRNKFKKTSDTNYYDNRIFTLEGYIESIRDAIKEIKINRLNKQKCKQKLKLDVKA